MHISSLEGTKNTKWITFLKLKFTYNTYNQSNFEKIKTTGERITWIARY